MLTRLWAIAWKDIYTAFQDRNAMLYMFAMPLGLSLIIGLAFGGDSDITINSIPVAVINQDAGAILNDQTVRLGEMYQQAFVPTGDAAVDSAYQQIHDLTDGELAEDQHSAREAVEDGDLAALITLPESLSESALFGDQTSTIDVYYDSGQSVGPGVIVSIVRRITTGLNAVVLAQRVGPAYLADLGQALDQDPATVDRATARMTEESMAVAQSQPIRVEETTLQGETRQFSWLQYFAPSMAILFMTFAMASGASSILDEQRRWTLQRIMTTATPRPVFMGGKLVGMFLTGVLQMVVLIVSTSLFGKMMGSEGPLWGTNYVGIVVVVLVVVFTATSLGLVIAALTRTPEQASSYSTLVLMLLGMLGGTFIPIENLPSALDWLPKISLNYWGIRGFMELSYYEGTLADIGPHVTALLIMGAVFFVISLWRFERRLDI